MTRNEFVYTSRDGATGIHVIEWVPDGDVRAVLQIANGVRECIADYGDCAEFLAEHGFYVIGNDHLGHGKSVIDREAYGYFAQPKGNECLVSDLRGLHRRTMERFPDVPYFMLGYDLGSFLTRQYMTLFGSELGGVIVMGTGAQSAVVLRIGKLLARLLARRNGWHSRSEVLQRILPEADAVTNGAQPEAALTVNGYYEYFRSIEWAQNRVYLRKTPKALPVLLVSGREDPAGAMGKGVEKVHAELRRCGIADLQMKLYPGCGHDLLHTAERESVEADLLHWMEQRI